MIEIAPNFKIQLFELNIYENIDSRTNTNDTVIARYFADSQMDCNEMMALASINHKGFKYKLTDYAKKSRKSKTGIF